MDILITFVFGVAVCFFLVPAVSLAHFICGIEEGGKCKKCEIKQDCFAQRSCLRGRSNYLSEWMLVSYLRVRRKCEHIKKAKGIEIFCYILFLIFLMFFLFWSKGKNLVSFLYAFSVVALLSLSIVDWKTQYIPFEMNLVIFLCGFIRLFADNSNWLEYVIGLIAVSGFLLLVNKVSVPFLKKKYDDDAIETAIGDGDIKLMAATGLLLGWKLNFLALGIGCVAGSVIHLILMKIKKGERQFALGPYLSLGVYITMICGEQLISWYLNMMGVKPL